jgi:hypothetical protein
MKLHRLVILSLSLALLLLAPASALAQDYYFQLPQLDVHVIWQSDGTASIDYIFYFKNDPAGHAIEYVDVGLPNGDFDESSISAEVNGHQLTDISASGFQGSGGQGVAVGLGVYSIPPGGNGRVHVFIGRVRQVLRPDTSDPDYASAVFSPAFFLSDVVYGTTDMQLTFHLPPGVQPDEPRWHASPGGNWSASPITALDDQGRVTYTWRNPAASPSTRYPFGASFPTRYVPAQAIVRPNPFAWIGRFASEALVPLLCIGFFALFIFVGIVSDKRRKLSYLPPKISIEGHGIKRGLTAIEAAILMEEPVDKVLTLILFSVVKKNAATVAQRDPLVVKAVEPAPAGLNPYETDFLAAFKLPQSDSRRRALQNLMVELVRSVSNKMKGFSRKETIAYYRDIMQRAWAQVEAAQTPEVKSQKFDEVMEWTMLDRDYDRRTRDVFHGGPVFVPVWWPRYDPTYRGSPARGASSPSPAAAPSTPGGRSGTAMPNLPGSEFAASIVTGVQTFSRSVVGNVTEFTSGVTNITNPAPKPSASTSGRSSGSGGASGCACACACACAGCACACAGGGR